MQVGGLKTIVVLVEIPMPCIRTTQDLNCLLWMAADTADASGNACQKMSWGNVGCYATWLTVEISSKVCIRILAAMRLQSQPCSHS